MRLLIVLFVGLFFIACGGKKVEMSESSSSQSVKQEQPQETVAQEQVQPQESVEVVEEYVPPKAPLIQTSLLPIYFAFDSFTISKRMFENIDKNAQLLKEYPKSKIILQGNTDAYGSDEYNFALGTKRALAVKDALIVRGIHRDQISTVSFGETNPVCTSLDAECRQKNRRVDFVIESK